MNDSQIDEAEQRIGLYRDELVDTLARLKVALSNAQEVIHLQFCVRDWAAGSKEWKADDEHWKECSEAQAALKAAEEATE